MRTETSREKYLNEVFGVDDPALARVRESLRHEKLDGMAVSPHEARLLQFLIRAFAVRAIVEVGTLFGYSTLAMAGALPADGSLISLEKDEARAARAREVFADDPRVRIEVGDASTTIERLTGPYDMVFIDANKAAYVTYLDWAERVVRPGGLIVGDNTLLWGSVHGEPSRAGRGQVRAMREFNRRLSDPARYNSILIPTVEGLTVAQRRPFDIETRQN